MHSAALIYRTLAVLCWTLGWQAAVYAQAPQAADSDPLPAETAHKLLETNCFDCHAYGAAEGSFELDKLIAQADSPEARNVWWRVLKNVRSELMPPSDQATLSAAERGQLIHWIEAHALQLDPQRIDPGGGVLRRLNRREYRNTIADLMGIEFESEVEFPPDDTGHGFDTVADAMSISPLLMEKYLQAAEQIVFQAVPLESRVPREQLLRGGVDFQTAQGRRAERLTSFYQPAHMSATLAIETAAEYEFQVHAKVHGGFDFDPARCRLLVRVDDQVHVDRELAWGERGDLLESWKMVLDRGSHEVQVEVQPLVDESQRKNDVRFELRELRVLGPTDPEQWVSPPGYERFFPDRPEVLQPEEQAAYARQVVQRFATLAFRRPVEPAVVEQLLRPQASPGAQRPVSLERSVAQAMIAALASPRFVFRIEQPLPADRGQPFPRIDEYALASRLSYFLWSSMPDQRLWELASGGRLRLELESEVARMVADPKFRNMSQSFVGQWLQTQDVETVSIDPLEAAGARAEYDRLRDQLREQFGRDRSQWERRDHPPEIQQLLDRYQHLRDLRDGLTGDVRRDLRRETEALFHYIASEDQSVLDLIAGRYSFLNRRLADFYGLPQVAQGLDDRELERVEFAEDSPRGGVLAHGSFLMVTSNPTRTSPVKRGLAVLENILGTPSPPPPAAVPELEAAAAGLGDKQPTLRQLLARHREDALCASCHNRFDPLGLALENFNALGLWRETEHGEPIDAAGKLITGEEFRDIRQLKQILVDQRRADFYRCLASKMLTYALGRGPEYHDEVALNQIVADLERSGGKFSALLMGIIRSAAFDRMRAPSVTDF